MFICFSTLLSYTLPCSVVQSGESDEPCILMDQKETSFFHIVKFIWPDWHLVMTGVIFYSVIGASYPIIGALMAHVNNVSPISTCPIVHITIYSAHSLSDFQ